MSNTNIWLKALFNDQWITRSIIISWNINSQTNSRSTSNYTNQSAVETSNYQTKDLKKKDNVLKGLFLSRIVTFDFLYPGQEYTLEIIYSLSLQNLYREHLKTALPLLCRYVNVMWLYSSIHITHIIAIIYNNLFKYAIFLS